MGNIRDLFDDFETIGLDESKWGDWNGDVTVLPKGGLRLGVGAAANTYTVVAASGRWDFRGGIASIRVDTMIGSGGSGTAGFYLGREDGSFFGFTSDGTYLIAQVKSAGVITDLITLPWNISEMRYWRMRHIASTRVIYYETSRDGQSWVLRAKYTETGGVASVRVEFQTGYFDELAPGTGYFTIRYFNTQQTIDRGPGYLTETFDYMRTASIPYNKSWGSFRTLDDGGDPTNVAMYEEPTGGKSIRVRGDTEIFSIIRTDLKKKILNMDMSVDVVLENNGNRVPAPLDIDTARIAWRVQGSNELQFHTRYELTLYKDYAILWRINNTSPTLLKYIGIGTTYGVRYRWRIVHVGSQIVIHRSIGDFDNTGQTTPAFEIARARDTGTLLPAGQIGFIAYSASARFDNFSVKPARSIPSQPNTYRMKARKWGAFATRGEVSVNPDGSLNRPVEMLTDPTILEELEEKVGRQFDIASWFLDLSAPFPLAQAQYWASKGRNNLMSWGPEYYKAVDILAGGMDTYMDGIIAGIKQVPTQTYIRLMPEMNGEWAPWSVGYNFGPEYIPEKSCDITSYAQFIEVWKYIHDYFSAQDAGVKWVFCVNETDEPRTNTFERYYPGDDYVDLNALDAYNWGNGAPFNWRKHDEIFEDCYNRLCGLSVRNPIWVTEFSAKEPTKDDGKTGFTPVPGKSPIDPNHSKGQWVHDLMEETKFARIEALIFFSIDKERDWRMESSEASLNAFKEGFASAMAPQEWIDLDPQTYPLPIPNGWNPIHSSGRLEYLRLEEDGYAPLQLEPSYGGIWLAEFDLGYAEIRESVSVAAQRNGTFDYTNLRGAKSVSLEFQIIPYMNASVPYMVSLISRWADPRRRPTLVYKPFGGDERRIRLRASQLGRQATINRRDYALVSLQFVVPDGVEESTLEKKAIVQPNAVALEVVQSGTAECYPTIRLYGPMTNPIVYNETMDTDGDARLGFETIIAAGQFLEINIKDRSVQLNGWTDPSANRRGDLVDRRWFSLVPFSNMIRLETDAGTGHAEIMYHDTWL